MSRKRTLHNKRSNQVNTTQTKPAKIPNKQILKHQNWFLRNKKDIFYWCLTILIGAFFFWLGQLICASKKDIITNYNKTNNEIIQLRQDVLGNNDYKSYLEVYKNMYKGFLESIFTGGYMTIGARNNETFYPDNFKSKYVQIDINPGTVKFNGTECLIDIPISKIKFLDTDQSISSLTLGAVITDYRVGVPYKGKISFGHWSNYIIILNDNPDNPVFVFGFSKEGT